MWLDSVIGFFSPKMAYKRLRFQEAIRIKKDVRKYEGASKTKRTEGWTTSGTSANSEIRRDITKLRDRCRDLVRNNPYANRAIRLIGTNVVGRGIRPNISSPSDVSTQAFTSLWDSWANSTACDFDCMQTYSSMQKTAIEAVAESGSVLIRRRIVSDPNSPLPLKLQILESDFIATTLFSRDQVTGNRIVQGIELDDMGCVAAYHLFKEHPGNFDSRILQGSSFETVRVPVEEILHLYRIDRPGQLLGVPFLAPVMLRLWDLDTYEDAQLVKQKISSCYSVFVRDNLDIEDAKAQASELGDKLEPGIIEFLPAGKTVEFANPPPVENYDEYTTTLIRSIAIGVGLSYEALSGNLQRANFSSARMGHLEMNRNIETWRQTIINDRMNGPVFNWFRNFSAFAGMNGENIQADWIPPRRDYIDPTKEIPAQIKGIRAGILSLEDEVMKSGKDPQKHLEQIAKTNQTLDQLDLTLDSDPRKTDDSGDLQDMMSDNEEDIRNLELLKQ